MSNRVHGWIRNISNLADVVYSTDLGGDAASFVSKASPNAVIAVPDLSAVPGPVIDGLAAKGANVVDGTELLARLRAAADPAELALLFRAASIAHDALATLKAGETDAGALIAEVDATARRAGAEEVYIAFAPDLARSRMLHRQEGPAKVSERFAIRASIAYKGAWVRMTRTLLPKTTDDVTSAERQFAEAVTALPDTGPLAKFKSWLVEGSRTTQPLEALAGSLVADGVDITPGSVVTVQATIDTPSGPILTGGPVLVGRNGERSALLRAPSFA
jgi:hypothetical protein